MYDAVDQALAVLAKQRLSTATIVLLSDGADIGSNAKLDDVLAKARSRHVRVFTVGLRSGAFQAGPLQQLSSGTGGAYAEASSAAGLAAIYDGIRRRLAGEYLIRYTSEAAPRSDVDVAVSIPEVGTATKRYTAPTPSGLQPFHRSLVSRFLLSPFAVVVLSLLVAGLAALVIWSLFRPRGGSVVARVDAFSGSPKPARTDEAARVARAIVRRPRQSGWFAKLEERLEIARVDISATRLVVLTLIGTVAAVLVLGLISPVFALLGLLTPLISRSWVSRRLKQVRDEFADQLPPNLQVLASALRIGHSFVGALTVVVDNAHEPSRSELQRVVADERIGVPLDEAIQRVAVRMASRDLEQVALLAELQRTAGGNSAEVLDAIIGTLRERADLRRLVKTLTAQGRMARWILTALPIVVGLGMFVGRNELMRPLYESGGGQVAIVVATMMVVAASLVIQRIIDINV
jgi:tight adherence protein B